jgi:hypothetical protein
MKMSPKSLWNRLRFRPEGGYFGWVLNRSWLTMLGLFLIGWIALACVFALLYRNAGGIWDSTIEPKDGTPGPSGGYTTDFFRLFYFSIVTQSTVGYGDVNPRSDDARTLAMFHHILGGIYFVIGTGLVLIKLGSEYQRRESDREKRRHDKEKEQLATEARRPLEEAERQLNELGRLVDRGLTNPLLCPFLQWYYDVQLWSNEGVSFPAVVFPVETFEQQLKYDAVLAPWTPRSARLIRPEDCVAADPGLVQLRRTAGRKIDNRQTYCLDVLETHKSPPVIKSNLVGYYEDCLATSDSLEQELLVAFGSDPPRSVSEFESFAESKLPLRNSARSHARKFRLPHLTGAGRSAAIAITTLTIARTPESSFVTFFGYRSGKTAAHPNLLHLAPSGMFQPVCEWQRAPSPLDSPNYQREWTLRNHILREVSEELFSRDIEGDFAKHSPETADAIYQYPEVQFLDDLLKSDARPPKAQILVTGILMNLLNLRPEICTVLLIRDSAWYRRHSRAEGVPVFARNWEFKSDEELLRSADKPRFWHAPIWADGRPLVADLLRKTGGVSPSTFVLPGAVGLVLGLKAFEACIEKNGPR